MALLSLGSRLAPPRQTRFNSMLFSREQQCSTKQLRFDDDCDYTFDARLFSCFTARHYQKTTMVSSIFHARSATLLASSPQSTNRRGPYEGAC